MYSKKAGSRRVVPWGIDISFGAKGAFCGVRRQSGGRRSHAATALWLREAREALELLSCLAIRDQSGVEPPHSQEPLPSVATKDVQSLVVL